MFCSLRAVTPARCLRPPSLGARRYAFFAADKQNQGPSEVTEHEPSTPARDSLTKVEVDPNHGLWHFFRRKEVDGKVRYETVEPHSPSITGRSWTAAELRRKSFSDLHTLWYIVLRERNLLATQKEEARRLGVPNPRAYASLSRVYQCRKTMARIKCVLNERRLGYEGAIKLLKEQQTGKARLSAVDQVVQIEGVGEKLHEVQPRTRGRRRPGAAERGRAASADAATILRVQSQSGSG